MQAVPRAKKFVSGKSPQWDRATVAYLLALYDKKPEEAGVQLELVCKGAMRSDFDPDTDKVLFGYSADSNPYPSALSRGIPYMEKTRSLRQCS